MSEQQQRPRCPVKGCPVVFRGGPDRLCPSHQREHDMVGETSMIPGLMDRDRAKRAVSLTELQARRQQSTRPVDDGG